MTKFRFTSRSAPLRARLPHSRPSRLTFERLESRRMMAGVVIHEFLASNTAGIADEDGERHDWIELKNLGAEAVDLAGWSLTDNAANLAKWQLPAETLAPGGTLLVFASDKNRSVAGQPLHTNFRLAKEGEYLALVAADGQTVVDAFAPYPPQYDDISFGRGADPASTTVQTLVGAASPLRVISPTGEDAAVDDHWRSVGFNDASWLAGTRSVGFDRDGTNNFGPYIGRVLSTSEMPSTGSPRYTAYVRYAFDAADVEQLTSLLLTLRFDDGFIAYLNGREVARANFGEDFLRPQPQWDSRAGYQQGTSTSLSATNRGVEALAPVEFDLSAYVSTLRNGPNVLAFHLVNSASTAAAGSGQDLLLEPVLTTTRAEGEQLGYLPRPTPGRSNGVSTLGFVGDTHFSIDRGFFDAPFQTAITAGLPTASIRYTTDGSLPSATHGTLYAGPITISTTTILRAIAYQDGYTPTNVDTQTYIFLADVIGQNASSVTQPYATWGHDKEDSDSLSGYNLDDESDWAMDPRIVSANLATIVDDLKSLPSVSIVMDWNDLFGGTPLPGTPAGTTTVAPAPQGIYIHGTSSERYASFEYINPHNAADQVHIDAAIEMQGHSSILRWNTDKMSFHVKFKYPYGPTDLRYPLFAGTPDGANAAREFDTLILDAGYNYTWTHANVQQRDYARFVSDQVVADLQNLASGGGQAPHGRWVHLYLNGLYWGMYNLHERPDDSFAAEMYGGNKDDYNVVKATNQDVAHNYSWVEGGVAAELDYAAMLAATRAVEDNPASAAHYAAVQSLLDVDQFIDYMIVHYYAGGGADWSHNNWYASRHRNGGLWRFHAWDQEHAFPTNDNSDSWTQTSDLTGKDDFEAPTEIHRNLIVNDEYRLRFADRVQALLHNGGVLTPAVARGVYEARLQEIDRAIVAESARWGDNRVASTPYTRNDFLTIANGVLNTFFPARTAALLGHFAGRGWLASLAAPTFNQYGGAVEAGFQLTMAKPAGSPPAAVIYYTTDGSDPRLPGGGLNPAAVAYSGPVTLAASARVQARLFFDAPGTADDWSPVVDHGFVLPEPFPLRIVELHYNPAPVPGIADAQDLEFFELLNTGPTTISLNGVRIAGFASAPYVFADGLTLEPGGRIVVARTPAIFTQHYGLGIPLAPGGYANANLSNGGELVQLLGPAGELLQSFVYDDSPPWPTTPDGGGYSLEIIDPLGDPANPANWRASYYLGGSPGFDGLPPTATPGDFNGDDLVDGADFLAWQRGLGTLAPHATRADGDADGDGDVDADDLALWQVNFGPAFAAAAALWHDAEDDQPSAPLPTEPWILVAEPPQRIHRPAFRPRAVDEALSRFSGRPAAQLDPAPASGPSRPTVENPSSPPESIDPVLADAAAFALAPPR